MKYFNKKIILSLAVAPKNKNEPSDIMNKLELFNIT